MCVYMYEYKYTLTGYGELNANAVATSISPTGGANVVTHVLFLDRFEHQQQSGFVAFITQFLRMDPAK